MVGQLKDLLSGRYLTVTSRLFSSQFSEHIEAERASGTDIRNPDHQQRKQQKSIIIVINTIVRHYRQHLTKQAPALQRPEDSILLWP